MKRVKRLAAIASGLTGGLVLAATPAWAESGWGQLNLPYGVTPVAHENYDLNMFVLWICIVIGIIVFGAMAYSIYHHRKSVGHEAAVHLHHSTVLEVTWTIIPIVILVVMAVVATKGTILLYDTSNPQMDIKVTGVQWMWRYDYPAQGIGFYSKLDEQSNEARRVDSPVSPFSVDHYLRNVDQPLVVPIHTKIRFLVTADDVIHAWWVPDFGWKVDAIPGYINKGWVNIEKPGVYRGQCAELCGRDHAYMPIVVEAKTKEDFEKWVAEEKKREGVAGNAEKAAAKNPTPSANGALTQAGQRDPNHHIGT
ncbi:MAG TPA: cytochrome c oxidase subunit II [Nitrococcus sp.]|nr:cytochrome c oxidase subunit II [Nitrococcus sp.]